MKALAAACLLFAMACGDRRPARAPQKAPPIAEVPLTITFPLVKFPGTATIAGQSIRADSALQQRKFANGMTVPYAFVLADTMSQILVDLDSVEVPATGTIVMDRPHSMIVITVYRTFPPAINDQNRELYRITREMLASPTPATLFQRLNDEVGCMVKWYGGDAQRLISDANLKAIEDAGGEKIGMQMEQRLAGARVEARECTKEKPR